MNRLEILDCLEAMYLTAFELKDISLCLEIIEITAYLQHF